MSATADDTSVLATVINGDRNAEQIGREAELGHDQVRSALRRLKRRKLVRNLGSGYWLAEQRQCARCSRRPSGGAAVYVDPETFRWFCQGCWEEEVGELQEWFDA